MWCRMTIKSTWLGRGVTCWKPTPQKPSVSTSNTTSGMVLHSLLDSGWMPESNVLKVEVRLRNRHELTDSCRPAVSSSRPPHRYICPHQIIPQLMPAMCKKVIYYYFWWWLTIDYLTSKTDVELLGTFAFTNCFTCLISEFRISLMSLLLHAITTNAYLWKNYILQMEIEIVISYIRKYSRLKNRDFHEWNIVSHFHSSSHHICVD